MTYKETASVESLASIVQSLTFSCLISVYDDLKKFLDRTLKNNYYSIKANVNNIR